MGAIALVLAAVIVLPMVFVIVMFYLFMRQLQAGGGKAMSFGKSRARLLSESQNKITFEANLQAARAARINLSSKLLRLATEVIQ